MQHKRFISVFLACSVALVAVVAHSQQPAPSNASMEAAKVKDRLAEAVRSKRLDDISQAFSTDGTFLTRTTGRITGRAAIRGLFEKVLGSFTSNITMTSVRLEQSGDLAFDSGDFEETVTSTADVTKKYTVNGNYLLVLKREHGNWLILEQVMTDRTSVNR
jgi:ketosteroid isomerase-like protein